MQLGHTMMTEQAGPKELVAGVVAAEAAGFTHLALVQIGGDQQQPFIEWSRDQVQPAWREAFGG